MAVGQQVLGADVLDVAELDRLAACIESEERDRSLRHARQLRHILDLNRVYARAGMALSTVAYVALLLQCSESRAQHLLCDAKVLQRLGALEDMTHGLLTVEQSRAVVDVLGVLPDDAFAVSLWERLRERLIEDQAQGVVRPPARLRELLARWVIAADPEGYAARRKTAAEVGADVELWKRGDGLADLAGRGLCAADAQACLDRIEQLAQPTGPDDERTAGQRRRDVYRDLLLGRVALPIDQMTGEIVGCCPPGSAAPCGASVFVHVPLASAIGDSDGPAELVGHGPVDPGALRDLLAAGPVLHRVWTDAHGVPVAVDDRVWTPGHDPAALRQALAELRTGPLPELRHPIHPDDHPRGTSPPTSQDASPPLSSYPPRPRFLTRPHLADPGGYVPPRRLQQLLRARAPRCEWPGCGRRAARAAGNPCDLDHDLAWPFGPTCACNIGPLCRRHHRIKQEGWTKQRATDGSVRWTDPTGRTWTCPSQHPPPPPARHQIAPGVWTLAA